MGRLLAVTLISALVEFYSEDLRRDSIWKHKQGEARATHNIIQPLRLAQDYPARWP